MKKYTYEDLKLLDVEPKFQKLLRYYPNLYKDCEEEGGIILTSDYQHIDVFYKMDIEPVKQFGGNKIVGLLIRPCIADTGVEAVKITLALEDGGDIVDGIVVAFTFDTGLTFKQYLVMGKKELNQCFCCHKQISLKKQKCCNNTHMCPYCYTIELEDWNDD